MEPVARFHALDEVMVVRLRIDEVDRRLIDGENVGRGDDADVGNRRFRGGETRTVAVHRHAAHHVDEADALAEVVARRLGGFRHGFHEELLARPLIPGLRNIVDRVDLLLADLPVGAADGDVLHGTAEAAHRMPLEVRQNDHGVVVADVLAHRHGLEMLAALHGKHRRAFGVHDVDRTEGPAVHLERFQVFSVELSMYVPKTSMMR